MPSTSTARSPSPHDPASGRPASLLSRFKAPFATKTRHIGDFFVQPDDPHRQYGPGDVITGSVILKILKPLRVTHVTVCLHGFVQVYKAANTPGEGYKAYTGTSTPGKTMRMGYFGNGFASLFVDEVALCGEGRLGEGTYQFGFELVFPKDSQPSSINFERGTIAYMITCTLTKPTTIAPVVMRDREVRYGEDIDIASFPQPKPRVITLEPLNKRARPRHRPKRRPDTESTTSGEQRASGSSAGSEGTVTPRGSATTRSQVDGDIPISPAPSEVSTDSYFSSSATGSARGSAAQSRMSNGSSRLSTSEAGDQRPISTSIQISRAGFLRGDTIQIRVAIQHRKVVRSLHGVIVTFYRQARVDMHPSLPIIDRDGKPQRAEDYYPKSKTGLGGLSLSAAGSSHVFRKDLAQSFASLLVNPDTLSADIKAAVRVPEEAFPSIACVPGNMISFKYYVEVILDIQGKLTGLDRFFPSVGNQYGPGAGTNNADSANGAMMSAWGGHFIDTQDIRREKSVISSLFEVTIGTRDSERVQGRVRHTFSGDASSAPANAGPRSVIATQEAQSQMYYGEDPMPYEYDAQTHYDESWGYDGYEYHNGDGTQEVDYSMSYGQAPPPMPSVHLPDLAEENELPEKERLRRAEARLLPSQPPEAENGESSAAADRFAPSAPVLGPQGHVAGGANSVAPTNNTSAASDVEQPPTNGETSAAAPAYSGPSDPAHAPTDDKQELQRRRLQMERSAPAEDGSDGEVAAPAAGPSAPPADGVDDEAPSAPVLAPDEDGHVDGDDHEIGSSFSLLPKYER